MLAARLPFAIDTRRLRSFDGTEIVYHVTEAPRPGAPWIVLAGGLGGGTLVWRGQIEYLRDRYRLLTWDYRGLYGSERPRPEHPGAYAVSAHARDLEALLAAERIDRASFAGWSVGVQVVLEAYRRLRGCAHSLVLVSGPTGRPLDALFPFAPLALRTAALPLLDLFRRAHALPLLSGRPIGPREAAAWLKRLRLVGRSADPTSLAELTASVARLDLDAFLRNLQAFAAHDAGDVLPLVAVSTLVVSGDRDPLLSPAQAEEAARRLHAELLLVRGGAHALPLEYPELLALRMERFYEETGL
jgi:pimeloyl-ACP methyl ester carboxylesterase